MNDFSNKIENFDKKTKRKRKEFLLASFYITNPIALRRLESHWKKRDPAHSRFLGRTKRDTKSINPEEYGGCISLIDPNNFSAGFLAEIKIPIATGMCYDSKEKVFYVNSYNQIKIVSHGKIIGSINNRLFNDLHGLAKNQKGNLLVVSTGIDAIIEINPKKPEKPIWIWLATKHGYDTTPSGKKRIIDLNKDYRNVDTCTPQHTTHINSCLEIKPGKVLATLFHQGELIEINKKTGKTKTLVSNLKSPHHIRYCRNRFILSDTRNQRVLFLNKNYKIIKILKGTYNWVQDAILTHDGNIIIADSNNARVVKIDISGEKIGEFKWNESERKISSLLTITDQEAINIFGLRNKLNI
jgi:hypothetical protein